MKNLYIHKVVMLVVMFVLSSNMISNDMNYFITYKPIITPLYDNIWGTIYNAEEKQCDDTPTITGDGSKININAASNHRWIAISHEMLYNEYRQKLVNDSMGTLYKGKIQYGDTVWIDSPYKEINGWWVVHDTKNKRYKNSIDFLQTKEDGTLYKNNPMWNGRFDNIKIYNTPHYKI